MNFVVICLHCLDYRDFHSEMRDTPFLDRLRREAVFIPSGRAQGHHQCDSLNAEMTGQWSCRMSDSVLTDRGFKLPANYWFPPTILETLQDAGYQLITAMNWRGKKETRKKPLGSFAAHGGLGFFNLKKQKERIEQFQQPRPLELDEFLELVKGAKGPFYAHVILRDTHRPWDQAEALGALVGKEAATHWPDDAYCARQAALDCPEEFAALRRRGLARADRNVERIFNETKHLKDVTYLVYSSHGEVFDHFRYHLPFGRYPNTMIVGTSHGAFPYEVVYANMQQWVIPGQKPRVMRGTGRQIDVAATILDLAGVKAGPMDAESMLPYFAEGVFPERDRYAETAASGAVSMVRADGMKLISTGHLDDPPPEPLRLKPSDWVIYSVPPTTDQEGNPRPKYGPEFHKLAVYDLRTDPWEYVNLIDTPQGREVLAWAVKRHAELKPFPGQEPKA